MSHSLVNITSHALSDEDFQQLLAIINLPLIDRLHRDGESLYTPTYWIPSGSDSTLLLEQLLARLTHHAADSVNAAGVEWWLSVQDPNADRDLLLDFHFDQDIISEGWPLRRTPSVPEQRGRAAHPILSSVFFLRTLGIGDLVVSDQRYDERLGLTPPVPSVMELVRPQANHYAVFDGTLYHAVAGRLWRPKEEHPMRVNIAINYWKEKPNVPHIRDTSEFISSIAQRLSTYPQD